MSRKLEFPRRTRLTRWSDEPDEIEGVTFISKPASPGVPKSLLAWWQRVRSQVGIKDGSGDDTFITISGGAEHGATAEYATIPGGYQAKAYLYGQWAYAAGGLKGVGSAQCSLVLLRRGFTSGSAIQSRPLYLDGASRLMVLENNTIYGFQIHVTGWAVTGGVAAAGSWKIDGLVRRGSSAGSTTLVGSTVTAIATEAGAPPAPYVLADTTNGALGVYGYTTGVTGQEVAYVAAAWLVEGAY